MILWLALMVMALLGVFLIGWYVVCPALIWLCDRIFALSIKGAEYHAIVTAHKSGEVPRQCSVDGCCDACKGTGYSGDTAVPNGMCWDCRGTGHPHSLAT